MALGPITKRKLGIPTLLILLAPALLLSIPLATSPAHSSPSTKPLHFYLHYTLIPPSVGGVSTKYIMDTDQTFQNVKNTDFKGIGQPKIQIDWYLYPNFAGPVTFSGAWQVIVFVNSTALHPATWGLQFWEKRPQGSIVWDSGALSPDVKGGPSGNPGYVDVPIFGYTLTAEITHTFNSGNTLEFEITINSGSTTAVTVWYDSPFYPSHAIFPSTESAKPELIRTLDANTTAREVFFTFWREEQRKVVVSAEVTDPFGGYDIYKVTATITDSANRSVITNQPMNRILGDRFSFTTLYEIVWSYPENALQGKYRINITVIDNNGKFNFEMFGTYEPYLEFSTTLFSIGIQFPIRFIIQDNRGLALPGARLTLLSNGLAVEGGITDSEGKLDLTVFTGPFTVQVSWYGTLVADRGISITNASTFTIRTAVYYPQFNFISNAGEPINRAMIFVTAPNGTNIRLPFLTDAKGAITLPRHPAGEYGFLTFWEGVLVADAKVNVTNDGPYSIRTQIYNLAVDVTDNSGAQLQGVQVVVSSGGRVFDFGITGRTGQANFSLPAGSYGVSTYYSGSYWLNYIVNTTHIDVAVSADNAISIPLSNVPPPIYVTIGFWLIAIPILLTAVFILLRRRRFRA